MKIGIIADTHDRWDPRVAKVFRGVDEIWHLGDVCHEAVLDELRALTPNLLVVQGNNDFGLNYPLVRNEERGGERFTLIHILPRTLPTEVGWLLFGHTHVPRDEKVGPVRLFNPGSSGLANKGAPHSVGLLIQEDGKPFRAEVILLARVL